MAVVQSEGSLLGVERRDWPTLWGTTGYSVELYQGLTQDYATIYRTQPAVRTVVDFLARNIAQLGLHTFRRVSDEDRVRLRSADHPVAKALGKPTPVVTPYELAHRTVSDIGVYDNAYWVKVRVRDMLALQPIPANHCRPIGKNWFRPEAFEVFGSRGKVHLDPDQVVHFHGYDPSDLRQGLSPIETLRRILAEEHAAGAYREKFWRNAARPSGIIERPRAETPQQEWSEKARDLFGADWKAKFSGDGPEAGGTPILEDGMTYKETGFSAHDSEYLGSRKLHREEVAAVYHIAPTLVGILDHATFSNVESQHVQMYQDTLGPPLQFMQQVIKLQFVDADYPADEDVYVEFNLEEKLKGTFTEKSRAYQTAAGGPWMLRSEVRSRENLPEVPGFDEPIVPMNVTQGGQASPTDSAPPLKGVDRGLVEEAIRSTLTRQKQVVRSRAGSESQAAVEALDVERWTRELSEDLLAVTGPNGDGGHP